MFRSRVLGIILLTYLVCPIACDATALKDVQIGVRIVDFLANPPPPRSPMPIIFDSHIKESLDDARNIMTWLSSEASDAKMTLMPVLVDVHNLDDMRGARVAFVADSMEAGYAAILDYARKYRVLTISADLSCVRAGKCMVGVSSSPRVEVIVNRQVSEASGVNFTEAFRMMVNEY